MALLQHAIHSHAGRPGKSFLCPAHPPSGVAAKAPHDLRVEPAGGQTAPMTARHGRQVAQPRGRRGRRSDTERARAPRPGGTSLNPVSQWRPGGGDREVETEQVHVRSGGGTQIRRRGIQTNRQTRFAGQPMRTLARFLSQRIGPELLLAVSIVFTDREVTHIATRNFCSSSRIESVAGP